MKVFNSNEFVEKCRWLVTSVPNIYYSKNGTWDTYVDGKWRMDCVVSIKGLLWGFKADPSKPRGGAVYGSNGVADFGANAGINYCTEASQDFNHLVPGEYLCMKDTFHEHAGVYLGNGKVFECTTGWGTRKCIISEIDNQGNRFYNGVRSLKWTWHGKLNYIDYIKEETNKNPYPGYYLQYNPNKFDENVMKLQKRLIQLGYSCGIYGADGYFGKDTKNAVLKFQKDHKLSRDAIVGPLTWNALFMN